jgi:hypothetical protein
MKAIQITQQNKINFPNFEVGKRYKVTIPKRYIIGNDTFERYDLRAERHESDGFLDLTIPDYNSETQRLGEIIESETGEAAIDSLVGKGWTITVTGGYTPTP